ncbi:hypothetical protein DYST_01591 [Dyella terrae]|nr:hypothetical protein DYST_01591 [Dyella terrae]
MLGHLRRYIAGTSERFATRPGGEDLKQASLRFPICEARESRRYAFLPLGRGKGDATLPDRCGEPATLQHRLSLLPWLCALEKEQRDLPRCDVQRSCTSLRLGAYDLRAPCAAVRGGREDPQGGSAGRRSLFAGAGAPSKSPATTHELTGFTGQRQVGVPFFGLLFFGQAKKSDSASGRRAKARRRRARSRLRDNQAKSHWIPAFAGMTVSSKR